MCFNINQKKIMCTFSLLDRLMTIDNEVEVETCSTTAAAAAAAAAKCSNPL